MRRLSTAELIDLGDKFGVNVGDDEAEEMAEKVNEMLSPLDEIDDLPVWKSERVVGERTWREPNDDPYDAIVTACHVPPTETASDLLAGTTVGVKDIISVAGVPMECGSAVMRGYVPRTDATVVERLRAAGATITAKTNLDEFGGSARGTTGNHGPVRNPHDRDRTAGGSSGGSAAAVAAGHTDVALGTDTGGSVRIPASFCGVAGLKPSYGLLPLSGIVENTYTQDHVGPLSSTIAESARVLEALAGKDSGDPASMAVAGRDDYRIGDFVAAASDPPDIGSLSIGVLEEGFGDDVTAAVTDRTEAALDALSDAGAAVERVSVEEFRYGRTIKNVLSFAELADHWRDGGAPFRRGGTVDEGYQTSFADRGASSSGELSEFYRSKLLAGARLITFYGGRHYVRAQAAREVLYGKFEEVLQEVDVVAMPTMPDVAPALEDADDPGFDYARNTRIADVTRLPAVSIPNGTVDGLPVGFQLMAPLFGDDTLLAASSRIEPHLGSQPGG